MGKRHMDWDRGIDQMLANRENRAELSAEMRRHLQVHGLQKTLTDLELAKVRKSREKS